MKKCLLSLLLALALVAGVLPGAVWAEGETTPDGYMVIVFEMYDAENETVMLLKEPTKVGFTGDDTGTVIAKRVLGDSNVNVNDGGWINSFTIDGTEYDATLGNEAWNTNCASWSVYKNNAEDQVAIGGYKPSDGDVYRVILTTYDPANNYAFPTMPHNLDALYWAMAEYEGDLSGASELVQSAVPTQDAINAKAEELSSAGGEHRIFIDQKTVLVDKSQYPYACTPTLEVDKTKAAQGETVTVTATVPSGYAFKEGSLKASGVALDPVDGQDGKYTFTMPDSHVSLTAEIEILELAKLDGAVFSYDEAGTDAITLTPSFSSGITEYALTLYDYKLPENTSKVYSTLRFGAGTSASWQYYMVYGGSGFYTPGPNSDQTVSGAAYGHAKADIAYPGMTNDQKHRVDVTADDGAPNAYYFRTTMLPTLSDLKIGENTVENFAPDIFNYTVTVPANTETIILTATAYDEDTYYVYFEGDTQDENIAGASTELALDSSGTTTVKLVVDDGNAVTATYTLTVKNKDAQEPSDPAQAVMDAIAAKYAAGGIASDENAPWIAADMAAYARAFPGTASKLTDAQKQEYLNVLIPAAASASTPSDLSKYIIALRAMGYDARKAVTAGGETVDLVKKLTDLVDAQDAAVGNVYTLPYVLIALQQGADYATAEQIAYLKEKALEIKDMWQSLQWDSTDAAPPMILALSPYYGESSVKAEIDKAVQFLKDNQDAETGALNYGGNTSASSTGIAAMAIASIGTDPAEVKVSSGKSLIDGLMSAANEEGDGFDNAFGTEQGFRGLVAAALQKQGKGRLYDFSSMPMDTAHASVTGCPVRFSIVPDGAALTVKLGDTAQSQKDKNFYDLPAGSYTYIVTKSGYRGASGSFEVTAEEAAAHTEKNIAVSLVSEPGEEVGEKELTVTVRVLTHDGTACGGKWTYKDNPDKFTTLVDTTVKVKAGQTALDAFVLAMEKEGISYTEKTSGYISEIAGQEEFGHGSPNSGWQYMVGRTLPTVSSREYELKSNMTITWFYTDDYTKEKDSEQWSGGGSGGGAAAKPAEDEKTSTQLKPEATAGANGEAGASVTEKELSDTIAQAKSDKADIIVITPEVKGKASKVSVELPKSGVDNIAKQTGAALKVDTGIAAVTIPQESLNDLAGRSGSKVTVSGEAVKDTENIKIEVAVDGKPVEKMGAGIAVSIPAGGAGNVLVIVRADGSEEIVKKSVVDGKTVSALLDGSATVKVVDNSRHFADTAAHWAKDAVDFASSHELFNGVAEDAFAPDARMSRAMLATVLWRLENEQQGSGSGFADVPGDAYYAGAVSWASGMGIVNGTGSGFAPDKDISREELATMLYRYAGAVGMDTGAAADLSRFDDSAEVSDWAVPAMRWAVGSGLMQGSNNALNPSGSATRAEVAAVMQRLVSSMVK